MAGDVSLPVVTINPRWKIAIVRSLWHPECVEALHRDVVAELKRYGISTIIDVAVPGSFEIPLACQRVIRDKKANGVIALGVIVEGTTHHARLIADQAAAGIMQVQLQTGVPIAFEILYVDRLTDARERSTGKHAKGALAVRTLLLQIE